MSLQGQLIGAAQAERSISGLSAERPTFTQQLEARCEALRQQLHETEEALAALKDSPEAQRAIDAIAKLGHI